MSTLDKLSKILAKAENTDNEAERDTFMHAAEQMAATLGIELAVARAHSTDKTRREEPIKRSVKVGNYGSRTNAHLVELFLEIAEPHDVRCTISSSNVYVHCYGLPSDIDITEALFGISLTTMVGDADKALKAGLHKTETTRKMGYDYDLGGYRYFDKPVDGRIWRANFYVAYRTELRQRLWLARSVEREKAEEVEAGVGLVLLDKEREVKDFYDEQHKHVKLGSFKGATTSAYVGGAAEAGRTSAQRTNLGTGARVGGSTTKSIQ